MPVVVTGAAGFIGRHAVAALLDAGHAVVSVDRRRMATSRGHVHLVADLTTRTADVRTALGEANAVLHLAGRPGVRDAAPDVARGRWHDNVVAGEAVLTDTPADTPLVVASSSSVYGGTRRSAGQWLPCHEDQPLAPRGGYAASKAALEERCATRRDAGGHVVVVRPFTVAGEGQRDDMALATWIEQARRGQPFTVLGAPTRRRDVTDVRDVVAGMLAALELPTSTTINLGTGRTHTLHELTAAVARHLDVPHRVELRDADPVEVPATRADTRRCQHLLGLLPRTNLDDLVRRQVRTSTSNIQSPNSSHSPVPIPEPV